LASPPHLSRIETSILNPRFRRCAQVIALCRCCAVLSSRSVYLHLNSYWDVFLSFVKSIGPYDSLLGCNTKQVNDQ
jgi:hypothetical protein